MVTAVTPDALADGLINLRVRLLVVHHSHPLLRGRPGFLLPGPSQPARRPHSALSPVRWGLAALAPRRAAAGTVHSLPPGRSKLLSLPATWRRPAPPEEERSANGKRPLFA